ncbi:MAG: 7-cyano-7-deazaguanine synthase QueC [Gammaproteobacteria bacterium]|nr:7-cyano-7-deazaguanine synthase QueC [Gammaproteobacteria bacterium]
MNIATKPKAVVLLSGGLDSATVLAMAIERGYDAFALSVYYGQRHSAELAAAARVASELGAREHRVMGVDLAGIGGSALTDHSIDIPTAPVADIPVTYVSARNTLMLSLALGWAEVLGAQGVFIGVNAVDFSGYPDCRPEYIAAFAEVARLGTRVGVGGSPIRIEAPLVRLSKAEIIREGHRLGVNFSLTVSCYQADEAGRACGRCNSCCLRRDGFLAVGVPDPTRYV